MNEDISRLMDGEVDDDATDRILGAMKGSGAVATWACYHAIGDALRGECSFAPRVSRRIAVALAQEPTVLAPRARGERPVAWAWAAAATVAAVAVVGWTAISSTDAPNQAVAFARDAAAMRSEALRPQVIPADYLTAHSDFSPSTPIQRVSPIQRADFVPVQAPAR
ncbi:MAG TPA: sigma-E factor negative regulatory protein [Casimicrobiaceae bacterium]|mgnify:CR=1 FL=1|nr:sigma-E factor negative regulatory protein [Casimicrobiaceae bacterium]